MAKVLRHEELRTSIIIDGNQAQSELSKLEKSTRELNAANKDLRLEKQKLEKLGKKESAEYKAVTAAIRQNNATIRANKTRMTELRQQVSITGMTMTQLRQEATRLRASLSNVTPGSADYIRYENDLKKVNARLKELRVGAQATSFSLGKMADGFNRYFALVATIIASLTGVVVSIQKIIDYNGKLSDSQADVMKTTGLAKTEVDELTKSFGLMKTRTARIELLQLAEEAGRLGIEGTENVKAFVRVANQLKVALGDDLNETQIRDVGKLVETYKIAETTGRDLEGSLLSLGSAINEVSASGSNQAGFLVDFLKRTTGISAQVKLSAADNIGYAATFDELGQNVEVTATTMNKLWADMAKNTGTYAKITNMSVNEFKDLLEKDANKAMITFLKALKNNNAGFQQMIQLLDDVEAGGTRGDAALSALVSGVEKLEEKQRIANQSMSEATSLTDEYNIKNNNLAASLDKIKKTVTGWFSSEGFVEWLEKSVNWFAKFIGATEDTDGKVTKFRNGLVTTAKVFAVLLAALVTNVAWQKLVWVWTNRNTQATLLYNVAAKGRAVAENLGKIATLAYIAVTSLLTGNIKTATIAMRGLTVAMGATPWGAILAIVAAVTTAIVLFSEETDAATLAQRNLTKVQNEATASIEKEEDQLNRLLEVARDETNGKKAREEAIRKINDISPEYLGNINLENINTQEATKAIYKYLDALKKKIQLQSIERALDKTYDDQREIRNKENKDYAKWYQKAAIWIADPFNYGDNINNNDIVDTRDRRNKDLERVLAERKLLEEEWKKTIGMESSNNPVGPFPDDYEPNNNSVRPPFSLPDENTNTTNNNNNKDKPKGSGKKPKKDPEKQAHEKRLREIERFYNERLRLEREYQDGNIALMEEGYDKELQAENLNFERRKEDLKLRLINEEEIIKAEQQAKNENLTEEQRKSYAVLANQWRQANSTIYQKIEQETALHLLRKATLVEKFSKTEVDELKEAYENEKVIREQQQNEELIQAGSNKKERAALEEKHRQENYEAELKYLQDLLDLYNDMIAGEEIDGIDFSLLTPEQRKQLEEDVERVKLAISGLRAAKAGEGEEQSMLSNGESSLNLSETDILGFSPDQWETFFTNIEQGTIGIETMTMAVQALGNMWAQYSAMVEANEARLLQKYEQNSQKKQNRLERQFNSGLISQEQYNRASQLLENDLARKKAELEYKQAKRKRNMDIANVIVNTSLAIMKAVADLGPIAGAIAAVLMGTMGAVQLATIKSQPLPAPGFEDGLYPQELVMREQDGQMFNSVFGGKTRSGLVTRPTHFLTGENGPEMIIDSKAYKQLSPDVKNSLIRELRVIKGFEDGLYPTQPESNNIDLSLFVAALERNSAILEKLEQNGILAVLSSDFKTAKKIKDLVKDYENFRNSKQVS